MALTFVGDGYLIIPQNMESLPEGSIVYCYKETFSNRLYLTDKRSFDEEMFFKTKIKNRRIHISSDVMKHLNSIYVSVTARDVDGKTKLYLNPFKNK